MSEGCRVSGSPAAFFPRCWFLSHLSSSCPRSPAAAERGGAARRVVPNVAGPLENLGSLLCARQVPGRRRPEKLSSDEVEAKGRVQDSLFTVLFALTSPCPLVFSSFTA